MAPKTVAWDEVREQILADPKVKSEYDALEDEFTLAQQTISLRTSTGLSQREFSDQLGIKQPQLARIESGKQIPKLETLAKLAAGAGYTLEIHFVASTEPNKPKIKPLQLSPESFSRS